MEINSPTLSVLPTNLTLVGLHPVTMSFIKRQHYNGQNSGPQRCPIQRGSTVLTCAVRLKLLMVEPSKNFLTVSKESYRQINSPISSVLLLSNPTNPTLVGSHPVAMNFIKRL